MKRFLSTVIILLSLAAQARAAGSFSMGFLMAADGRGGGSGEIADQLNREMRSVKAGDPAAVVDELPVYYAPALTVNFRYLYNRLMLQLGWEYAASPLYNESGSIDPTAGAENRVEIQYSRFTFPLTAALVIPSGGRTRFYMGGGLNVSFVMLEINQSTPGVFAYLPDEKNSYAAYIPGFHVKFGAEALLSRNYSILFEYTKYMSKRQDVESENGNSEIKLGLNTFEIGVGVNYTVDTGL